MNVQISEITLDKLHAFARRRRFLIAVRGGCVGIIALLLVMGAIALADFFFVIRSQSFRWLLTLCGYAVVALVIWLTCLRSLLRIPGPHELARRVEQAAPGLREDLISAVELGAAGSDPRYDSPVFRALLQASVEDRMSRVRVAALLPGGLIRRVAMLASFVLTVCVAMLLIPDLHFASRLTRALLPSAPIDRIANVRVTIVAPHPADALAPHNDAVNVIVDLSGDETDDVVVETFRTEEGRENERIALKPARSSRRFSGMIQLGHEPVKYRVLAGDAVTRTYTIATGPRPHAVAFGKTYRFPAYASLDARTVQDKHGNLAAIQGTKVGLAIEVDQPVRSGELRFDEAANQPPIPLVRVGEKQWAASVPLTVSTTYKVHLVAAETGFDNAFDPPYEINATPDQAPALTVGSPARDGLVPHGEAVDVKLAVTDDLGLAAVAQSFRINGGAWVQIDLADKPGLQWSIARKWDVYDLNLRPGDQIATRFMASDLAGHKTETAPVTITIAASGFEANRLAGLEAKRRVLAALAALAGSSDDAARIVATAAAAAEANAGDLLRQQAMLNAAQASQKLYDDADAALLAVWRAIKANPAGSDADDLVQAGLIIAQVREEAAGTTRQEITAAAGAKDAIKEREAVTRGRTATAAAVKLLAQSRERFAQIVAADEVDAMQRDLMRLRDDQQALAPQSQPDEPESWQRLARRQLLLIEQVKQAQAVTQTAAGPDPSVALAVKAIAGPRAEVEVLLAKERTRASVVTAAQKMTHGIDEALGHLLRASRAAGERAATAQGSLPAIEARLHQSIDPLTALPLAPPVLPVPPGLAQQSPLAGRAQWPAATGRLKSAGAVHEARSDADAYFVSDLGLLRRALRAIEGRVGAEPDSAVRERAMRVGEAFKMLEAGHGVADLYGAALAQANLEKWMRSQAHAVTTHARQWQWTRQRLASAAETLRAAQMPGAADIVAGIGPGAAAQILDVEMASRRLRGEVARKRPAQFEQIAQRLADVKKLITGDMARARAIIAAEAPTLPEQMAALAAQAKKLQKQAADAAKNVDPEKPEVAREEAKALQEAQQKLDAGLAELAEALRHDANKQDAFSKEGRERARDADDAAAMVREPADRAADAAEAAAGTQDPDEQQAKLGDAAAMESKLARNLEKLAEHFENLAEGKSEDTRSALRDEERELGLKREKDAEFDRMEKLAELAGKTPQEQMAALEKEARQNPAMQAELTDIARAAAQDAKAALDEAAAQERRVAQDLEAAQNAAQQANPEVAGQLKDLAKKAQALAGKTPQIAEQAVKGTANDAAQAAKQAGQELAKAGRIAPPAGPQDHEGAAAQAKALDQALKQAQAKLKEAEQQAVAAAKRVRDEESQATAKLAFGNVSDEERLKAADTMLHAKNREAAAKQAGAEAKAAAKKAGELAAEAGKIAKEAGAAANAGEKAIDDGLAKQPAIAKAVEEAAQDVARAQRHEERIESAAAAKSLAQARQGIKENASKQVGDTAEALAQAKEPAQAQPAVKNAEQAIADQAKKLEQVLKQDAAKKPGAASGPKDDRAARDEQAAKWMARALDELDRAANESKDKPAPMGPQATKQLAQAAKPPPPERNQPEQGGKQPGQAGKQPGQGGEQPGQGGEQPGQGGEQPGQAGKQPGQAGKQPGPGGKQPGQGGEQPGQGGKQPGPGGEQGGPSPQDAAAQAAQAVREAAQAQATAMARARQGARPDAGGPGEPMAANPGGGEPGGASKGSGESPAGQGGQEGSPQMASKGPPGDADGKGGSAGGSQAPSRATGKLPELDPARRGDWGKLPPRLARELIEGQRDEVPSEYRSQVEAYFRAIAQKAKQK